MAITIIRALYRTSMPRNKYRVLPMLPVAAILLALCWPRVAGVRAEEPAHAAATPAALTDAFTVLRRDGDDVGRVQHCRPGPWGDIEYLNIVIEAPDAAVQTEVPPAYAPHWSFPGAAAADVARALEAAGLSDPARESLLACATPLPEPGGLTLHPAPELLLSLNPEERARLYASLARYASGGAYRFPFRFETANPEAWFGESEVTPRTRDLLGRLVYQRGTMTLFSDPHFLLQRIPSQSERRAVMQVLHRQPTMLLHLLIKDDTSLDDLVSYWGGRGREWAVRPLLESLGEASPAWPIGVTPLLPPLPRRLLYTYDSDRDGPPRDCHWTSMNFFNQEPDPRFHDIAFVRQTILDHYRRVEKDFQLGDLILLRDRQGQVQHSCTYLADHLVFTKNGGEQAQPWVLMTLDDLVAYYSVNEPLQVVFLRSID
jgi:hypothetical protein